MAALLRVVAFCPPWRQPTCSMSGLSYLRVRSSIKDTQRSDRTKLTCRDRAPRCRPRLPARRRPDACRSNLPTLTRNGIRRHEVGIQITKHGLLERARSQTAVRRCHAPAARAGQSSQRRSCCIQRHNNIRRFYGRNSQETSGFRAQGRIRNHDAQRRLARLREQLPLLGRL